MGNTGLGIHVPSIAENSKGEEDLGDDLDLIDDEIPEINKGEESEDEDGSEVEPPQDDELSQISQE